MISEAIQRPIGPLAAWQWGLVIGGGYLGYRFLTGQGFPSSGSSSGGSNTGQSVGSPIGDSVTQGPQGEQGPPGPTGNAVTGWTLKILKKTPIYDAHGKIVAYLSSGTYEVKAYTINGVTRWLIVNGKYAGDHLVSIANGDLQPIYATGNTAPTTQVAETVVSDVQALSGIGSPTSATNGVINAPGTTPPSNLAQAIPVANPSGPVPSTTIHSGNIPTPTMAIKAQTP